MCVCVCGDMIARLHAYGYQGASRLLVCFIVVPHHRPVRTPKCKDGGNASVLLVFTAPCCLPHRLQIHRHTQELQVHQVTTSGGPVGNDGNYGGSRVM